MPVTLWADLRQKKPRRESFPWSFPSKPRMTSRLPTRRVLQPPVKYLSRARASSPRRMSRLSRSAKQTQYTFLAKRLKLMALDATFGSMFTLPFQAVRPGQGVPAAGLHPIIAHFFHLGQHFGTETKISWFFPCFSPESVLYW